MNARQRFVETIQFGKTDRIPFVPGNGRESTLERWHHEGLPAQIRSPLFANEYAYKQAGGKLQLPLNEKPFLVKEQMIPEFERKIIEKGANTQIVQDWKGNICEIGNEYTVDHLGGACGRSDFVTRRWIKCPVETRADWKEMKKRYNPADSARFPVNIEELGAKLQNRDYPIEIHFSGPYWQLREWLGFENLSMMFYDDPGFVEEMIEFWGEYVSELLRKIFSFIIPDSVHISEDMAYKNFSMVSPEMCRKHLLPCWKKWGQIIHNAKVPVYAIDSDGYIGELIPLWIEAGMSCCDPIEVAAGNDINEFRKKFGKNMAYRGGVDKRCIAEGGAAIENEIKRITPVIKGGGFIPGCDHGVPHDISWNNYVHYIKLLAQQTGWLSA